MKYKVRFPNKTLAKRFQKELKHIAPIGIQNEIVKKVLSLANNPRPYGEPKIKPPVEVYSFVAQYRIRVGQYRVLYDVDDKKKIVWIFAIRKRDERTY